jgi:hypothetical protein
MTPSAGRVLRLFLTISAVLVFMQYLVEFRYGP